MNAIFDQPKRKGKENVTNLWMEFININLNFGYGGLVGNVYALYTFSNFRKKAFLMKSAF